MYGVVLWSDIEKAQALIWCEDHGKLAFFEAEEKNAWPPMQCEAGDLVQVDIDDSRAIRRAFNLVVVAEDQYSNLVATLRELPQKPLRPDASDSASEALEQKKLKLISHRPVSEVREAMADAPRRLCGGA